MRAFTTFALPTVAIAAFGGLVAAQAGPEITTPAVFPTSDFDTTLLTPLLTPDDERYIDASDGARLAKRSPPAGVYICDDKNWKGNCKWYALTDSQCVDYPYDADSSFGPPLGWQCKIFYGKPCTPGTGTDGKLTYPGTTDVGEMYNRQDNPASYMCRQCSDVATSLSCVNNNAPEWYFAQAKFGYGGDNHKCSSWVLGKVTSADCLPQATVAPQE